MRMRSLQDQLSKGKAPAEDVECMTLEISAQSCKPTQLHLCPESYIRLFFNGRLIVAESIFPKDFEAYAIGLLLTEGLISSTIEIESLDISSDRINIKSSGNSNKPEPDSRIDQVDLGVIYRGYLALDDCARVCLATGGTHCALLLTEHGGIVAYAEDVNRLASLDKVIGKAALAGHNFGECILFLTGRTTEDTIRHASMIGISVVAACGAPSSKAVRYALNHDICLLTIPGPHQVIIYSGRDRIQEKEWKPPEEISAP